MLQNRRYVRKLEVYATQSMNNEPLPPVQERHLWSCCSPQGQHIFCLYANAHKKLGHNLVAGELETHLLHLSHTLHHHYHVDDLLEVAEGEQ